MYRFSKFSVVCFFIFFPVIAMSQDYTNERYNPRLVFYRNDAVLGQLVDGAGWKTTISLVNLDTQPASFTLYLFADNGTPMTLAVADEGGKMGFGSTIEGTIPVGGSTLYATEGTSQILAQGWAGLDSARRIAGQAVFRRSVPGFPDIEAVVPFTSMFDLRQILPFDNTGGFMMGVALANPAWTDIPVTLSFRICNGTPLFQDTIKLAAYTHVAFLIGDKYPQTKNQRGVVEITTPGGTLGGAKGVGVGVLGLRGNPSGGLTTVFSLVSPDWVTQR